MKRGERLLSQEQYAQKYPHYALECAVKGMLLTRGYRVTTDILESYFNLSQDENLNGLLGLSEEEQSAIIFIDNKVRK